MTVEIIYSKEYTNYSREELIEKVAAQMSEKRFAHVLRVEEKAIDLAKRYDVNLEMASIAALTHDYAKERSDEEMITFIKENNFNEELIEYGNAIWHGILGSELVKKELGITNHAILNAVKYHTTGAKVMDDLTKVIYVADYVEDGRDFPVVNEARAIAEKDLDQAVAFETKHTLLYLINKGFKIYPKTLETYNEWVVNK